MVLALPVLRRKSSAWPSTEWCVLVLLLDENWNAFLRERMDGSVEVDAALVVLAIAELEGEGEAEGEAEAVGIPLLRLAMVAMSGSAESSS